MYISSQSFPIGIYDFLSHRCLFYSIRFKVYSLFLELSLKSYQKASVYKLWHLYQWVHLDWHTYGVNTVVTIPE